MEFVRMLFGFKACRPLLPVLMTAAAMLLLSAPASAQNCADNGYCDEYESGCCRDCSGNPNGCDPDPCGNGVCDAGEPYGTCNGDCGSGGDGQCQSPPEGYGHPDCPRCGDGVCQREYNEVYDCRQDCPRTNNGQCFDSQEACQDVCAGVCERRINCGGPYAYKCFE